MAATATADTFVARAGAGAQPSGPAGTRPRPRPSGSRAPAGSPAPRGACAQPMRRAHGEVRQLAALFAVLYLEVESGRRPAALVSRLLDARLVAKLAPVWYRPGAHGRLLRVAGALSSPGVYDAVAVVQRGERVGALGLRLVHNDDGWMVADVVRPEDGPLPEPDCPAPADERLDAFDLCDPDVAVPAPRPHAEQADAEQVLAAQPVQG